MKRLSSKEAIELVKQLDNLIAGQSFDDAINLGRKTLKSCVLPDTSSITAILERIKLARAGSAKSTSKTQDTHSSSSKIQPTIAYHAHDYTLPEYQSFNENTEKQHLSSLVNYIKSENRTSSNATAQYKEQSTFQESSGYPDHEDIIQIGINKTLAKDDLAKQKEKQNHFSKAVNRPFFARFDFKDSNSKKIIYISDSNTNQFINSYGDVHYVDWRAPITSLYYTYQQPTKNASFSRIYYGTRENITGDIDLVAQYTIKNGAIENYNCNKASNSYTSSKVSDDILQEKLKSNSSTRMKAHADTLQAEQYRLTSYNPNEDLIIQGVAGSGKTVVALSRLVFLKYRENKNFSNENILYISPNADFSKYVSDVSIGLGETRIPIKTITSVMDDVFNVNKGSQSAMRWEELSEFAERNSSKKSPTTKKLFTKSFQNKFYSLCNRLDNEALLIKDYNQKITKLNEFMFFVNKRIENKNGILKNLKKEQAEFAEQNKKLPTEIERLRKKVAKKIEKGALDVDESITELKALEADAKNTESGLKTVGNQIKGVLSDISKDQRLLEKNKRSKEQTKNALIRKLKCLELQTKKNKNLHKHYVKPTISDKPYLEINPDYSAKIIISPEEYYSSILPAKTVKKYKYEILPYYMIIKFLLERAKGNNLENRTIKHVVVDEAQDYTEPYFFFLRQAFPNAVFTILGDKNQNINPFFKYKSLEDLIPDSKYAEINTAYRSSPEIVNYCNNILKIDHIHSKRKSQNIEVEERTANSKNLINTIDESLSRFKSLGFKQIGIITNSQKSANSIQNKLDTLHINHKSLTILPVYKAKGLEYDAAIVINNFKSKELFYVACTRAKHALTVLKTKK